MRGSIIFGVALAILTFPAYADSPQQMKGWIYSDPAGLAGDIVIRAGEGQSALGHLASTGRFCAPKSGFLCFEISRLSFAVPSKFGRVADFPSSWHYKGLEFKATRNPRRLSVLGESIEVVDIEVAQASYPMRYLFSPTRGLLAIQAKSEGTPPIFILQQRCGFAAPISCDHRH